MWKGKVVFNHRKLASITFLKVNRKEIHSVVCSCPSFHEYHPLQRGAAIAAAAWSACRRRRLSKHRYTQWRRAQLTVTRFRTLIWVTSFWWMRCGEPLLIKLILGSTGCQRCRAAAHHTDAATMATAARHAGSSYSNRGALKIFHFPPEMPRRHIQ